MATTSATTTKPKAGPALFADGIYFGLPDKQKYHDDPALGSGDIRRLLKGVAPFYYESKFNPWRPKDKVTDSKIEGSAIHKIVLEGIDAFGQIYVRRPNDPEGASPAEKSATTKATKARLREGQFMLHGDVHDRTLLVGAAIASNPHLASAFQNGMPEVAVFWTEEGDDGGEPVRCKALIDYLKIRGNGDIKTIANHLDLEFTLACRRTIRYSRLPIQGALYWRGRSRFREFLENGQVHGGVDMDWLKKVAETNMLDVGWQWVFYQREGAPEVWSKQMTPSPRNPIWVRAQQDVDEAILRYQQAFAEFGPDKPWVIHEPVSELTDDELSNLAGEY